jgi:hypothetical protein
MVLGTVFRNLQFCRANLCMCPRRCRCRCVCMCLCPWPYRQCGSKCCSLHNSTYYLVSTDLSLTPPTTYPSLPSVCHIPALFPETLHICYDHDTIAPLPAADSHTVVGYHTDTMRTVLAMISTYLYLHSSDYCSSGQAASVHWRWQMFKLTLNLYCSLIYQEFAKNVSWWNECWYFKVRIVW